jgi:DHA2 family multidrug resistance protein
VIGCRGVGMLVGFMTAGFMSRIDPRISMAFGFGAADRGRAVDADVRSQRHDGDPGVNSAVQGFAVGVVWVPITVVAFDTLEPKDRAEASAVFHLLRNIGSSFFISLSIAEIVRTTGANYSRMTEMITPYNRALTMPGVTGAWSFDTVPGLAKVAKENRAPVDAMIGYLNAFMMYTATSALAVVFVLMVHRHCG